MDALKILVVDDESRMRKLVKDFLTKKNFQVLEAGDGEEAMDIFYKEKDIALLILDVMMPVMDGLTAARTIRALDRQDAKTIPIIAMTANAFREDAERCMEAGMNAHLAKPLDDEKIKQTISEELRKQI